MAKYTHNGTKELYKLAWGYVRSWAKADSMMDRESLDNALMHLKRLERNHPTIVQAAWNSHHLFSYRAS